MTCLVCTNDVFAGLPMHDQDTLVTVARQVIQGMVSSMGTDSLTNFQPKRRKGVSIVERCAVVVEAACDSCRDPGCLRCAIAAELRAAQDRIHADRDAELAAIGLDDSDVEEVLDKMVGNLCSEHVAFGAVLVGEWHERKTFLVPAAPTSVAALDN